MNRPLRHLQRDGCAGVFALAILASLIAHVTVAQNAIAHELRPAIATIVIAEDGTFSIRLSVNIEALIARIGPNHEDTSQSPNAREYDRLRRLEPAALRTEFEGFAAQLLDGIALQFDGSRAPLSVQRIDIADVGNTDLARASEIYLSGLIPARASAMAWTFRREFGDSVIRVRMEAEKTLFYSAYVQNGQTSEDVPLKDRIRQSGISIFRNYVAIGFTHIVPKGLDHTLFVIGIFLLNARLTALLWQVTAFTVAHTVTLALGMSGVVNLPATIVEPLIAASIVYVAVENVMTDRLRRWRTLVVFHFGLLHGLGFAGVLADIGLSQVHFLTGLVAFNLGVELGQLSVVTGCYLAVGLWFRNRTWYRTRITIPVSVVIALIGAYWVVARLA